MKKEKDNVEILAFFSNNATLTIGIAKHPTLENNISVTVYELRKATK